MRAAPLRVLIAMALLSTSGCGGGNTTVRGRDNGSLTLRARWEQPRGMSGRGRTASLGTPLATSGGFGSPIPAAVRSVVITFKSAAAAAPCCVAVDPTTGVPSSGSTCPVEPNAGPRLVVLRSLPGGPGTVSLFGFATDPDNAAAVCQGLRLGTPSFSSDPHQIEIVAGTRTDAGDIDVFALPFLLEDTLSPIPDGSTTNPVTITFTVAVAQVEGGTGIDPQSITIAIAQNGPAVLVERTLTPCNDVTGPLCSPGGGLDVEGFVVQSAPIALAMGAARARLRAELVGAVRPGLDFTYPFAVQNAPATTTATVPPSPTPSSTAPPNPTPSNTAPPSPTPSSTATPSPTPSSTATPSPTPSSTATPSPTPSSTATSSPTPSSTATSSPTPTPSVGVIQGTVVNCLTGAPISGATVQPVEPMLEAVVTGADGQFRFAGVPFGSFVLSAMAGGFIDSRVTGTLTPDSPDQPLLIALCPTSGAALRIVLTWDSGAPAPADLDAHLRGPAPGVPVEFHLYVANPTIIFPINGGATLDIASGSFPGLETESVDQPRGEYHFCVHNFTDRLASGSQGLANSGARVRLFIGDVDRGEFGVPSGTGNVWDVVRIAISAAGAVVSPMATLTDEPDPERVCRRPDDTDGDGLTDVQEGVIGTDPNNPDTNNNGVSDGQDVINGTNPLLAHLPAVEP